MRDAQVIGTAVCKVSYWRRSGRRRKEKKRHGKNVVILHPHVFLSPCSRTRGPGIIGDMQLFCEVAFFAWDNGDRAFVTVHVRNAEDVSRDSGQEGGAGLCIMLQ